jgi:hypothetical protein
MRTTIYKSKTLLVRAVVRPPSLRCGGGRIKPLCEQTVTMTGEMGEASDPSSKRILDETHDYRQES